MELRRNSVAAAGCNGEEIRRMLADSVAYGEIVAFRLTPEYAENA